MAGKRFAILIASSRYPEEPGLTPLRCPENDVDALNEVLSSPEFGQFSKPVVLKNKPSHEVLEQIETVLHDAGREDLVLIYFSGHGKLNPSGQLCLATANTKLRTLGSTSIPVERIKSFFDAADTRQRILILDCCYSGAVGKDFVKGGVDDQLQLMSGGQGTFIMTASTGIQVAVEKEGDSLGLFTKHLVEGIRSGEADRNEDGFVDIHELYQHVYEKVRAEGAQEPMKWNLHAKGMMIVALNPKNAKEKQRQELRAKLYKQEVGSDAPDRKKSLWNYVLANLLLPAVLVGFIGAAGWLGLKRWELKPETKPIASSALEAKKVELPPAVQPKPAAPVAPSVFSSNANHPQKGSTIGQYIDHGDGTITDTKSGLMWKRCAEGLSGVNCEQGKTEEYEWDDAVKRFKDVAYAVYSDWRLPTVDELKTLVQCSKGVKNNGRCNEGSEEPTINQQAFPNTEASVVWSGSPSADYSDYAWYVDFYHGGSNHLNRNNYGAVRLVRGGQ